MTGISASVEFLTMFRGAQHMDIRFTIDNDNGKSAITVIAVATAESETTCSVEWRTVFLHDLRPGMDDRIWPRLLFDQRVLTAMDSAIEDTMNISHRIRSLLTKERLREMWATSYKNPDSFKDGHSAVRREENR